MSTSPTFVATFAGGEVTRTTVFTSREKLDMARGVHLARAAYESRKKQAAPPIVEAHYERNGNVLEHYTASNCTPCHESPRLRPGVHGGLAIVEINDGASRLIDAIDIPTVGSGAKERVDLLTMRMWIATLTRRSRADRVVWSLRSDRRGNAQAA